MAQIYGTTKESNNLTPVTVTPEENQTSMTTSESANRIDTSSPDYTEGEKKKPSLLKKVKAKAKKLKDKLKPGHHHEGENVTHDDGSSSSSEVEDEDSQELGYTPLSRAVNPDEDKRTAHASAVPSESDYSGNQSDRSWSNLDTGDAVPQEDRKFGLLDSPDRKGRLANEDPSDPMSQYKSAGPPGVEQAVPTSYSYYNQDPSAATGGGDSEARREETPSALGGESAGIAPVFSDWRAFGSDGSQKGDESGGLTPQDDSKRSSQRSDSEDRDAQIPGGILAPGVAGTGSREGHVESEDEYGLSGRGSNQDVGMATPSSYVSDTATGVKDAALDKVGYGSTDDKNPTENPDGSYSESGQPTMAQKAYDSIVGGKEKLGYGSRSSSEQATVEPTLTQKDDDTMADTKDAVGSKIPGGDDSYTQQTEPTMAQKAYDTIVGTKESAAEKLGVGSGTTTQSNTFFNSKAAPVSEINDSTGHHSKPVIQNVGESAASLKNSIAGTLGFGGPETNTPRDDVTGPIPTSTNQEKPLTEKLMDTEVGLKETVATKLGYGGSTTSTSGEEMIESMREKSAQKIAQADSAVSSDSTPASQKIADRAYQARDSAFSTLSPSEDDRALSQTVTEAISNLPTLLTEKLGFGGHSPSAEGTKYFQGPSELEVPVSSSPSSNLSPAANTPSSAASPGIVNRVTEVVSSFFGGKKAHAPEEEDTPAYEKTRAGEEERTSTLSPSGSGRRDIADTSPMATDLSGENGPRSSPAA